MKNAPFDAGARLEKEVGEEEFTKMILPFPQRLTVGGGILGDLVAFVEVPGA